MLEHPRYTLLIVDDNANNIFTLRQLLETRIDAEILDAMSGMEALETLSQRHDIDLIVLDIQMPGMNGFEVAELIRQRKKYQDIPIIFLTAVYKSEKFKFQGLSGGAIDYLTKPIDDDMLVNRVKAYLRVLEKERKNNRQLQELNARLQAEIEERTRAQEALLLAKEQAEAANRAKSAFLANMSHELRTPLNGILGYAQLLGRDPSLTVPQRKGITIIQQSGTHLLGLLTDILDLSKLESGSLNIERKHFSLNDALHGVIEHARHRAVQKNLRFEYELGPDVPQTINGDEIRLRQILLNLLGNAVKFTEQGRVTLRVTQRRHADKPREPENAETEANACPSSPATTLLFEVEDTGPGFPEEHVSRLFLPFERSREPRAYTEGAGLGLALCVRLLMKMGSELQVSSIVGVGSSFRFELKLAECPKKYMTSADVATEEATESPSGEGQAEEDAELPLPAEDLRELYTLSIIGDILAIRKKLDEIEASGATNMPFVARLKELANALNILDIQRWLKQYVEDAD